MGRDKRDTRAQAGEADTGIATLRWLLVEHYRKLSTPTPNKMLDAEFEKEVITWTEANAGASEKEKRGSDGVQRVSTKEVHKYVAKLKNRQAAGTDQIVNELMKYRGEGMLAMMVMLYNLIWKNKHSPKKWREGVVVNLFKKVDKTDRRIKLISIVSN